MQILIEIGYSGLVVRSNMTAISPPDPQYPIPYLTRNQFYNWQLWKEISCPQGS